VCIRGIEIVCMREDRLRALEIAAMHQHLAEQDEGVVALTVQLDDLEQLGLGLFVLLLHDLRPSERQPARHVLRVVYQPTLTYLDRFGGSARAQVSLGNVRVNRGARVFAKLLLEPR
jgi:hypothetical protein